MKSRKSAVPLGWTASRKYVKRSCIFLKLRLPKIRLQRGKRKYKVLTRRANELRVENARNIQTIRRLHQQVMLLRYLVYHVERVLNNQ